MNRANHSQESVYSDHSGLRTRDLISPIPSASHLRNGELGSHDLAMYKLANRSNPYYSDLALADENAEPSQDCETKTAIDQVLEHYMTSTTVDNQYSIKSSTGQIESRAPLSLTGEKTSKRRKLIITHPFISMVHLVILSSPTDAQPSSSSLEASLPSFLFTLSPILEFVSPVLQSE